MYCLLGHCSLWLRAPEKSIFFCRSMNEEFLVENLYSPVWIFMVKHLFESELGVLTFINSIFKNYYSCIFAFFFAFPLLFFFLDEVRKIMFRSLTCFPLHAFLLTSLLLQIWKDSWERFFWEKRQRWRSGKLTFSTYLRARKDLNKNLNIFQFLLKSCLMKNSVFWNVWKPAFLLESFQLKNFQKLFLCALFRSYFYVQYIVYFFLYFGNYIDFKLMWML